METAIITLITAAVVSTLNAACFFIGASVRQKVDAGAPVEIPNVNPLKAWEEHREKKATDKENQRLEIILENLENYDGTPSGQKEIPE